MQVIQSLETVKIQTNNSQIFKQARSLIHKNLRKCIGKKSKLISFCDESELVQRRYFFKWLNCLNRRINNEDLHLEKSFYKALHLSLKEEAALKSIISAKIVFKANLIQINFSNLDKTLANYLKNYFKSHEFARVKNSVLITYKNEHTLELLELLCDKNEHLNRYISFVLDELEFLRFKKSLAKDAKSNTRFLTLCSLYEEQFATLGLEIGASKEAYKARYHELARKYHPDFHANKCEIVRELCAERFAKINEAYLILKPLYSEQQ